MLMKGETEASHRCDIRDFPFTALVFEECYECIVNIVFTIRDHYRFRPFGSGPKRSFLSVTCYNVLHSCIGYVQQLPAGDGQNEINYASIPSYHFISNLLVLFLSSLMGVSGQF